MGQCHGPTNLHVEGTSPERRADKFSAGRGTLVSERTIQTCQFTQPPMGPPKPAPRPNNLRYPFVHSHHLEVTATTHMFAIPWYRPRCFLHSLQYRLTRGIRTYAQGDQVGHCDAGHCGETRIRTSAAGARSSCVHGTCHDTGGWQSARETTRGEMD